MLHTKHLLLLTIPLVIYAADIRAAENAVKPTSVSVLSLFDVNLGGSQGDIARAEVGTFSLYRRPFGFGASVWSAGSLEDAAFFPAYIYLTPFLRIVPTRDELVMMGAISDGRTKDSSWIPLATPRKRLASMQAVYLYAGSNAWSTRAEAHFFDAGLGVTALAGSNFQLRLRGGVMMRRASDPVGYFLIGVGGTVAFPMLQRFQLRREDYLQAKRYEHQAQRENLTAVRTAKMDELRRTLPPEGKLQYEHWGAMLDAPIDVGVCSRYWSEAAGRLIDAEIGAELGRASAGRFQVHLCEHNADWEITRLTGNVVARTHSHRVMVFGQIEENQRGFRLSVRAYERSRKFLSPIISTQARIETEIAEKYTELVHEILPQLGEVTDQKGDRVSIVLTGGRSLRNWRGFQRIPNLVLLETEEQTPFEVVEFRDEMPRMIAKLSRKDLTGIASGTKVLIHHTTLPQDVTLLLLTSDGVPGVDYQISVSHQPKWSKENYVGLTDENGQLFLEQKNRRTLYVRVVKALKVGEITAEFEIPAGAPSVYEHRLAK